MNKQLRSVFLVLFVALVLGAVAMPAFADPPGVAARLSFMSGPVSLQPGGVDDWVDATINRPLTTSDRVWADQGGRAEVSMGNVKARVDQLTSMTIADLEDNITQLQLDQGTLFIHVRRLFDGESVEIDTPNVAFVVNRPGDYRFDVDPDQDTTYVSVRRGEGEGTGEAAGVQVAEGQQAIFSGGNSGQYEMAELGDPDDFDSWNAQRDQRQDRSVSARYVSPGVVGYDDLDDYGDWRQDPQYGAIWAPRVDVGWAPYRMGHWAWVEPWGYTWVDDAPWGFAPFHYGRWVHAGFGWAWAPGPRVDYRPGVAYVRPVYAPALVAFVGGGGFSVGVSVGGGGPVGWVPLGYGEPYYPSYHVSEGYVRNVNVTNTRIVNITNVTNNYTVINNNRTTVINEHYANQNVPGAVTAVPANAMATGRSVNQVAVKVDARQLQQAKFSTAPPVAPQKEAVLGGRAPAQQHTPPASVVSRPVMAKHEPPPPPAKFEARQALLQKNEGRPLDAAQVQSLPKTQRPVVMQAGKPRPAEAVQALKSSKPAASEAPKVRPPAAKGPNGPINAGRPNGPGANAGGNNAGGNAGGNNNRPGANTGGNTGVNAGRPNPNAPETNAPGRENNNRQPTPGLGNEAPAGGRNVPRPPSRDNTARPDNTPGEAGGPPARNNNNPNRPAPGNTTTPSSNENATPGARNNQRPPARDNNPSAPPARTESAPGRPANTPPARETAPPRNDNPRPSGPPAREATPPSRPPAHEAAPAKNPPAKESKPPKENNKDNKDNKKNDKPQ